MSRRRCARALPRGGGGAPPPHQHQGGSGSALGPGSHPATVVPQTPRRCRGPFAKCAAYMLTLRLIS